MTRDTQHTDAAPQTPHTGSLEPDALDPKALAAIRDLLAKETPQAPLEPAVQDSVVPEPAAKRQLPSKRELLEREVIAPAAEEPPVPGAKAKSKAKRPKPPRAATGIGARLRAAVTGYRPTPRHIVLASLALVVLFRPWLMLGVVFFALFLITAVFLILGYDGFWRRAMGLARWYARRHPSRAVELHRKLDAFAMRWDAVLDRFPEGSVDGLYLPDFGDLAEAEAKHDAALDRRFSDLRKTEA